jgi:4-alpha-glucanotransferase
MRFERGSGIILHPSSLPGEYGIGDLGPQAHHWLEFLAGCRCGYWQILPLGPTGYGDSPYQCFSAFAGNPYLISPEALYEDGLLKAEDLEDIPDFPQSYIDFGRVIPWKLNLLDKAFACFEKKTSPELRNSYERFIQEHGIWLDDFTLFMALKEAHQGAPWTSWRPELRDRDQLALSLAGKQLEVNIHRQVFRQFIFFRQWKILRKWAQELDIKIIGDIPIFVAHDSADVWANPDLFYLKDNGLPKVVAGVPPDYFSPTGQLWGNPLYRWRVHKSTAYNWWYQRFKSTLEMVDIIRLDHFRGFTGYWEVPARAKTAEIGRWVRGPGKTFFQVIQKALGELPIIAEDLGVITDDVEKLREDLGFPGMKIMQFSFEGNPKDPFLPHNFTRNCVVYTGTHDNDTTRGWYERVSEEKRDFCRRYLNSDGSNLAWDMIRVAWASVAVMALSPMQDFLNLGNEARMNYPGNPSGNWTWRMIQEAMGIELQGRIRELNYLYARESSELSQEFIHCVDQL